MRDAIDHYTLDKLRAPQSLDDLVSAGYIKQLPNDPFTGKNDTWVVEQDDTLLSVEQTQPGITDVHSGSNGAGASTATSRALSGSSSATETSSPPSLATM